MISWQQSAHQRLISALRPDGGCGYRTGQSASAEPTALACIALSARSDASTVISRSLNWLIQCQQDNGSVAINATTSSPCWPTSLAILAWRRSTEILGDRYADPCNRATEWLLQTRGLTFKSDPAVYGHNTQLAGWGWVANTHSWVEPTSYAILALRCSDLSDHPRTREAVELLLDRGIPAAGWNYGNRRIFDNHLRPFPAQTGMALAALAGEQMSEPIRAGINYLHNELASVRTPMSLGWGLIGLGAWSERPSWSEEALRDCAARLEVGMAQPVFDALLLLADAQPCPLIRAAEAVRHG